MAYDPRSTDRGDAGRGGGRTRGPRRIGGLAALVALAAAACVVPPATAEVAVHGAPRTAPAGAAESPAERGAAEPSRIRLAQTFLDGRTLREAPAFIVHRYRKRAKAGDARAQFYLGLMHERGLIGEAPDPAAARRWYLKAADGGYPPAAYKAGTFLEAGRGGPEDMARAAALYRRAAERGVKEAQYNYGLMLADGRGVARDVRAAIPWLERAALAGMTQAAMSLAEIHTAGEGTPVDPIEAWAWLKRAAEAGSEEARRLLSRLAPQMSETQLAKARRLKRAHDELAAPPED